MDINADRIGLTKAVAVGIQGDAATVAERILAALTADAGDSGRKEREELIQKTKTEWLRQLSTMDHEEDDDGTTWNQRARANDPKLMSARMAWRAIQKVLPKEDMRTQQAI